MLESAVCLEAGVTEGFRVRETKRERLTGWLGNPERLLAGWLGPQQVMLLRSFLGN